MLTGFLEAVADGMWLWSLGSYSAKRQRLVVTWAAKLCYPVGSRPGGSQAWPLKRSRRASSLLIPHLGGGGQVGLDDREVSESFDGAPAASRAALLDLDGPDGALCLVVGEDVQVRAGGEAEDHVLEVQEPAGDAAGVLRGGGPAVDVRGEPVRDQCPVAGDQVLQDGGIQDGLPGEAGVPRCVTGLDQQAGHLRCPVLLRGLEVVQVLQVPEQVCPAPGMHGIGE